jgi:hypothetical protein
MPYEKDNPLDGRAAPSLPAVPVLVQDGDYPFILLNAASGRFACSTMGDGRTAEEYAALALGIMRACNAHAGMLAALKAAQSVRPLNWDVGDDAASVAAWRAVEAAIAAAEGR